MGSSSPAGRTTLLCQVQIKDFRARKKSTEKFLKKGESAVELGLHQPNTDFRVFCYPYWLWGIQI